VGDEPRAVGGGDVNGDGHGDAVTVNGAGGLSRLLGNGLGSFGAALPFGTAVSPSDLLLVDLDIDGDLDLAVVSTGDMTLRVMTNDGGGTFTELVQLPTGASPIAVTAGDINEDGLPDLVVANQGAATVSIVLSQA
jgi:hypothetical protein